jgi:hypothetical protein
LLQRRGRRQECVRGCVRRTIFCMCGLYGWIVCGAGCLGRARALLRCSCKPCSGWYCLQKIQESTRQARSNSKAKRSRWDTQQVSTWTRPKETQCACHAYATCPLPAPRSSPRHAQRSCAGHAALAQGGRAPHERLSASRGTKRLADAVGGSHGQAASNEHPATASEREQLRSRMAGQGLTTCPGASSRTARCLPSSCLGPGPRAPTTPSPQRALPQRRATQPRPQPAEKHQRDRGHLQQQSNNALAGQLTAGVGQQRRRGSVSIQCT